MRLTHNECPHIAWHFDRLTPAHSPILGSYSLPPPCGVLPAPSYSPQGGGQRGSFVTLSEKLSRKPRQTKHFFSSPKIGEVSRSDGGVW